MAKKSLSRLVSRKPAVSAVDYMALANALIASAIASGVPLNTPMVLGGTLADRAAVKYTDPKSATAIAPIHEKQIRLDVGQITASFKGLSASNHAVYTAWYPVCGGMLSVKFHKGLSK
jgi:hypothetical protein